MSKHAKTIKLLQSALEILASTHPMTVRQVYYQLVSSCKEEVIPWQWIEDRLRRPRRVSMWSGLNDFAKTVCQAYRRDVWDTQDGYLEVQLEKDTLSGIFEETLGPYGVTLNVGRGYDGRDSIHNAAERFGSGNQVCPPRGGVD
jgi:hypothetical protein